MSLIETASWRIKQADHEKFQALVVHGPYGDDSMGLRYQAKHPEVVKYARTRTYFREIPGTDEEEWFFVDEYVNREEYEKSHTNYISEGEKERYATMVKLEKEMLVGTIQGPFLWEVAEGSQITFPDRVAEV